MTAAVVVLLMIAGALEIRGATLAFQQRGEFARSASRLEERRKTLNGLRFGENNLPGGEYGKIDSLLKGVSGTLGEFAEANRLTSRRALRAAGYVIAGTVLATAAGILAIA